MSINTTLAGLSTNPALNGPDGATDLPSQLDDAIRYSLSFTAQLRDGIGFTAGAIVAGLGYTPVQQGTGTSQLTNAVKIGWSAANKLRVQVDAADYGVNWPIDISGNAATATTATSANALAGLSQNNYLRNTDSSIGVVGFRYSNGSGLLIPSVNGNEFSGIWPILVSWNSVSGRPTDLGSFTNGPGYQTAGQLSAFAVQRTDSVVSMGNDGTSLLRVVISGFGLVGWGVTPSDERLKRDIKPSGEDSLAKIARISFAQFRFRQDVTETPVDDGRLHRHGVIAQQLEQIDPEWVLNGGTWKSPDQQKLLYAALHAIQQLEARVAALEARQ